MSHFKVEEKDLFFILKEQINYGSLCRLERYRDLDEDTLDMLVTEAVKFARGALAPLNEIGEKWGVIFEDGRVRCPPEFREVFRQYGENGWTAAARDPEYGGQGFPHMARIALKAMDDGGERDFYTGKVMQATYYAGITLPLTRARTETCLRQGREVVE
ncbi:MAG: hypothetical protein JRK53_27380, partial [Deltaproteobacteria bacterium]|nr:hypothetical protein [Deltaproteobacteria bacterium]